MFWNRGAPYGTASVQMIEDSYDRVVSGLPRRTQERLGWAARSAL